MIAAAYGALPGWLSNSIMQRGILTGILASTGCIAVTYFFEVISSTHYSKLLKFFNIVDALLQIPGLIGYPLYPLHEYPLCITGVSFLFQVLQYIWRDGQDRYFQKVSTIVPLSICLQRVATGVLADTSCAWLYKLAAVILFIGGVLPPKLDEVLSTLAKRIKKFVGIVLCMVHGIFEQIWPRIRDTIIAIFQHPLLIGIYYRIVEPCYLKLSPFILPVGASYVSSLCCFNCVSLFNSVVTTRITTYALSSILVREQILKCLLMFTSTVLTMASFTSTAVLLTSAVTGLFALEINPLSSSLAPTILRILSFIVTLPLQIWRLVLMGLKLLYNCVKPFLSQMVIIFKYVFGWAFETCIERICQIITGVFDLIKSVPILGLSVAIGGVVLLVPVFAKTDELTSMSWMSKYARPVYDSLTDNEIAFFLVAVAQVFAYKLVSRSLSSLQLMTSHLLSTFNNSAGDDNDDNELSLEDLNAIAATMDRPKQCGYCGFGPGFLSILTLTLTLTVILATALAVAVTQPLTPDPYPLSPIPTS